VVAHQLQVERRTAKAHRPKTDALPLDHVRYEEITSLSPYVYHFNREKILHSQINCYVFYGSL